MHTRNSFLTITYNNESLALCGDGPQNRPSPSVAPDEETNAPNARTKTRTRSREDSLSKRDLQLFTKRLNENCRTKNGSASGIRYYACGEYGDRLGRPHYHLALFGEDFSDDRYPWRTTPAGTLYRSSRLEALWQHGHCEIGELTFESAAYIGRYVVKKITGEKAHDHYRRTDEHGQDYWLEPEFAHMSRRPGIGRTWFEQYQTDVYPHDYLIVRNKKSKPPRYFDKLLSELDETQLEAIKKIRANLALNNSGDNTPERLRVKETVTNAALTRKRSGEKL